MCSASACAACWMNCKRKSRMCAIPYFRRWINCTGPPKQRSRLIENLRCAFFDLDNTLYPASSGLMKEIGNRINLFMVERLGIDKNEVSKTRDELLRAFG